MGLLKSIKKRTLHFQLNTLGLLPSVPVVQLFIHRPDRQTTVTLTNFPSLYSPEKPVSCPYELKLHDASGKLLRKTRVLVPVYGTQACTIEELFPGAALPEFGMLVADIPWLRNDPKAYAHLGTIHSYFFVMYHTPDWSSMGLIHPQTALGVPAEPDNTRVSNMLIHPDPLKALEVYQLNPSAESVRSVLSLQNAHGQVLYEDTCVMQPRQVRKVLWDVQPCHGQGYLHVVENGLTARNSKPMVFSIFDDGSFTASHT